MRTTLSLVRHQFTGQQYHQMAEFNILTENNRLELIWREMTYMSPTSTRHSDCVLF
ncbi:hypothetical protein AAFM79_11180 [Trichormus azollae HNT15244]